ncbi:MAG: hypothetical protein IT284_02560 [Bacteroidetes bacterium]|nr:hypothetical protein [Bacteroidota bacterium]
MGKFLKNTIIFIVIIAVLGIAYYFLVASKSTISNTGSTNSGLQSSTTGAPVSNIIQEQSISSVDANRISQEFVNQLLNLKAIKLDDSLFSSLSFQSLEDFTIVLVQPGNEGRVNPFAPFGADNAVSDQSTLPGISETDTIAVPVNELPPEETPLPTQTGS